MASTTARKSTNDTAIQAGIGSGFLRKVFGGKPFIHCVIELVKNCRDWGASLIKITTNAGRHLVMILDNGDGMNRANRNAFLSINMTTASGPRQSGVFCTGTKQTLFSHASRVEVRTAPKEEPDVVYVFSFTTEEYERLALSSGAIEPQRLPKDSTSWSHDFPFGTEITYTLFDPESRGIYRGERLAAELAGRLPRKFRDIVQVDGEPIPEKEIVGRPFVATMQHRQLGEVTFELYRPVKRGQDEELRLAGVEIGEAPITNLNRVLPTELKTDVPAVFLLKEVCGTITVGFIREYANEDRFTLDAAIADNPRLRYFLALLNEVAPEVQRCLQLKIGTSEDEQAGDELVVKELRIQLRRLYDKAGAPPGTGGDTQPDEDGGNGTGTTSEPAIRLTYHREVEIGEDITVTAKLKDEVAAKYSLSDILWYTTRSNGKNLQNVKDGIALTADTLGHGVIRADIPGTPFTAVAHYEVVAARVFRLDPYVITTKVGNTVTVFATHADKLTGDLVWKLDGVGELTPQGKRAIYRATRAGTALVTARDSANPSVKGTCDMTIVAGEPENIFPVRGEWFAYEFTGAGEGEAMRPVSMVPGSKVHRLFFRQRARGYQEAVKRGELHSFLIHAIASEFTGFVRFELKGVNLAQMDPQDLPALYEEMLTEQFDIVAEIFDAISGTSLVN